VIIAVVSRIPARSAPMFTTFATISSKHAIQSTHFRCRVRITPASPRPVTMPSRAHINCTEIIRGIVSSAVQSVVKPNWAPAIE